MERIRLFASCSLVGGNAVCNTTPLNTPVSLAGLMAGLLLLQHTNNPAVFVHVLEIISDEIHCLGEAARV